MRPGSGRLIETGYVMPHWPKPWGRDAAAVEQLVIEQEFAAAGVKRPSLGITGWVILTLIQHATPDQVARWVLPALRQDVIWCQLFSEPDAGCDAAGIKTRATRVDGGAGWSTARRSGRAAPTWPRFGLATVRTDPDAPKHEGITTMVIDMHADGVEVRPLQMTTGDSEFNEVFFNDVFVPDDDVVGPVNGGWTVARATLGNESVSIGGGEGGRVMPARCSSRRSTPTRSGWPAAPAGSAAHRADAGDGGAEHAQRPPGGAGGGGPGPRETSPSWCCPRSATRRPRSWRSSRDPTRRSWTGTARWGPP